MLTNHQEVAIQLSQGVRILNRFTIPQYRGRNFVARRDTAREKNLPITYAMSFCNYCSYYKFLSNNDIAIFSIVSAFAILVSQWLGIP